MTFWRVFWYAKRQDISHLPVAELSLFTYKESVLILLFLILGKGSWNMPALPHRTGTLVEYCCSHSGWTLIVCQHVSGIFKVSLLKLQLGWKRGNWFSSKVSETIHLPIALTLCSVTQILELLYWIEPLSIFSWTEGKSKITMTIRFIIW